MSAPATPTAAPTVPTPTHTVTPSVQTAPPPTAPAAANIPTSSPAPGVRIAVSSNAPFKIYRQEEASRWLKLLVYGKHGAGKTTLAGSAVDYEPMRDVLMLDCESGDMSIDNNPRIKNSNLVDIIRITQFKTAASIYDFLKAHCNARDRGDKAHLARLQAAVTDQPVEQITEPRQYRTVIIDSLSELDQLCMYHLLGVGNDDKIDLDMDVAQFAEFRKNNQMLQRLIRAFRNLPVNLICVCSAQYVQDEMKRMHFTPNLTGKLSAQVQGFMDVVGYLVTGQQDENSVEAPRRMYIQPVGKFDAKNRRANYRHAHFDNPTMLTICQGFGL